MMPILAAIPTLSWESVFFLYFLVFIGSFWQLTLTYSGKGKIFRSLASPLFYLQIIIFIAFPVRGLLIDWDIVYTQTGAVFPDSQILMIASLLALLLEIIVAAGYFSFSRHSTQETELDNKIDSQLHVFFKRMKWINLIFIITLSLFYFWTSFKTGEFKSMFGTDQFAARKGNGALYMPTVFIFMYIFCLTSSALTGWKRVENSKLYGILFTFLFISLPAQILAMVILLSRRDVAIIMALICLSIAIIAYKKQKHILSSILITIVVFVTFLASPMLDYGRNYFIPMLLGQYDQVTKSADTTPVDIARPDVSVEFKNESFQSIILEYRIPLITLSSSFEGVDHTAQYLQTRSLQQFLIGSDFGTSWLYSIGLSYVPRAIWKSKPVVYGNDIIQFDLYPKFKEFGANAPRTPLSFVVDFSYGFGIIGAGIICFILGRFFAAIYHRWQQFPTPIATGMYLFVFMNMFVVVRGGVAAAISYEYFILMIIACYGFKNTLYALSNIGREIFAIKKGA